jgi:hypothetical protein
MPQPQERDGVRYALFSLQVCDAVATVVAEAFAGYEPMMLSQNIPVDRMADYVRSLGPVLAQEELAVVAQDIQTDAIVGALITRDFADMLDILSDEAEDPINAILNRLDQQYVRTRTIRQGEYLHLNLLAVAQQYTGRAVAQNVVRLCLENGLQKGYRTAVTEATSLVSQHIFRAAHGFVARHEIPYQTFRYQGRRPFASIKEHPSVILMDKLLRG